MFPVIYFLFVTAKCLSYRGSWSLSHKRHTNGHMYYYKQTGNKTCYVRRRDEPQVLAEYKERQKWRQERKELNQQLMELSSAERREARQQMKLYQELGLEKLPLDKDISFDGTVLDSRAEIILYEFLKNLGIISEHNRPIDSGSYSYCPISHSPSMAKECIWNIWGNWRIPNIIASRSKRSKNTKPMTSASARI